MEVARVNPFSTWSTKRWELESKQDAGITGSQCHISSTNRHQSSGLREMMVSPTLAGLRTQLELWPQL